MEKMHKNTALVQRKGNQRKKRQNNNKKNLFYKVTAVSDEEVRAKASKHTWPMTTLEDKQETYRQAAHTRGVQRLQDRK